MQGCLQISQRLGKNEPQGVEIHPEQTLGTLIMGQEEGISVGGPSYVRVPQTQIAFAGALFLSDHVRIGLAVDGSLERHATLMDVGLRFGRDLSIESFLGLGSVPVEGTLRWRTTTHTKGCDLLSKVTTPFCVDETTTGVGEKSEAGSAAVYRVGFHLAKRKGGAWIEGQLGTLSLLPASGFSIYTGNLALGWSQRTKLGMLTPYARIANVGGAWHPMLGLQWTGELRLSRR